MKRPRGRCWNGTCRPTRGSAYVIESLTRLVPVESLKLDPNRMFSRVGAEANLKMLNVDAAPQQLNSALHVLDRGREKLLKALTPPRGGYDDRAAQ